MLHKQRSPSETEEGRGITHRWENRWEFSRHVQFYLDPGYMMSREWLCRKCPGFQIVNLGPEHVEISGPKLNCASSWQSQIPGSFCSKSRARSWLGPSFNRSCWASPTSWTLFFVLKKHHFKTKQTKPLNLPPQPILFLLDTVWVSHRLGHFPVQVYIINFRKCPQNITAMFHRDLRRPSSHATVTSLGDRKAWFSSFIPYEVWQLF